MLSSSFSLPGSSAAASASAHTCARHPDLLGERFCNDCGGPLCLACSRARAHRSCPDCNEAAGRPASRADVGWYVYLCVDSFLQSAKVTRGRVLPVASAVTLLLSVGLMGLFALGIDGTEIGDGELAGLAAMVFVAFFSAAGVCALVQPAFELPLELPASPRRRMWRAALGSVLPLGLLGLVSLVGGGVGGSLIAAGEESTAAIIAGMVLFGGTCAFTSMVLAPAFLPAQAASALRGASPLAALKAPFQGGPLAYLLFAGTHFMLLLTCYSLAYSVLFPLAMLTVFLPFVGAPLSIAFSIALLTFFLVLFAAYGSASLRFAEDKARFQARSRV